MQKDHKIDTNRMDAMTSYSLAICGDIVPTASNQQLFEMADLNTLLGTSLKDYLSSADVVIANLEAPLTNCNTPILKCGAPLKASPESAKGLAQMGRIVLSLANNHIMDYGINGLAETIKTLDSDGIPHLGAGMNLDLASRAFRFKLGKFNIAIVSFAEHEFSIATSKTPGANPFDPLESFDYIRKLHSENDYVIVLYHGGKEYYRYPSPLLRRVCNKFIDCGASLVICQHSHCIGCEEKYKQGVIVYGQGNFIFDMVNDEYWKTSLLVLVEMGDCGMEVSYLPLSKCGPYVRLSPINEARSILYAYNLRSKEILQTGFIEEKYEQFARNSLAGYLRDCTPGSFGILYRLFNRLTGGSLSLKMTDRQQMLVELNRIECEAHRELFTTGLKSWAGISTGGSL